jgi:hypothetical protein
VLLFDTHSARPSHTPLTELGGEMGAYILTEALAVATPPHDDDDAAVSEQKVVFVPLEKCTLEASATSLSLRDELDTS